MMRLIDHWLDRITMYRLLLYYLLILLAAAIGLSVLGWLHYTPVAIIFSTTYLVLVCLAANRLLAWLTSAPTNFESAYLTALILSLIVTPIHQPSDLAFLAAAGVLAMAAKYLLVLRRQHLFNPAALAVVITALVAGQSASWWVGTPSLLPVTVIGGLLVVHKIQRWQLVLSFATVALTMLVITDVTSGIHLMINLRDTFLQSPFVFLATVMLPEPLTSPLTAGKQIAYGALVGLLFPPQIHLGPIYSTPELALVVGNAFSALIAPKTRILPQLVKQDRLAPDITDFVFTSDQQLHYQPGQYLEWTLPHAHADARGTRRYFTLASSPTEANLHLGVKFYNDGSSFKQAMRGLPSGAKLAAGQLGGSFTLPPDSRRKIVLIAGGIGITPYRSMIKYLLDTNQPRPITLLYAERTKSALVYTEIFEAARHKLGINTIYILEDAGPNSNQHTRTGRVTAKLVAAAVPDYAGRLFYISGPHPMVTAVTTTLRQLGVKRSCIKTDFFPGYS